MTRLLAFRETNVGFVFFFVLFFVLRVYSVMEKLGFVSFCPSLCLPLVLYLVLGWCMCIDVNKGGILVRIFRVRVFLN